MKFRWEYRENKNSSIIQQIKDNRKLTNKFLRASWKDIPDIFLMKDLNKAAFRIINAVQKKEKIIIFGHDDLDGITATYILFDFLEKIGSQSHYYYIPNRLIENHGIQRNFIEKIKKGEFDLLVTVDGGISSFEAVEEINKLGCDVIITDHHLVQDKIPHAYAVVNPKQADCPYPYDMVAGVGVSFFLIQKLADILNISYDKNYLFWVALGSIADKVPLDGVNRILVKKVLDDWSIFDDETLKTLSEYTRFTRNHTSRMSAINNIIKLLSNNREADGENRALRLLCAQTENKKNIVRELEKDYYNQEKNLLEVKEYINFLISQNNENQFIFFDKKDEVPIEFLGYSATRISKICRIPAVLLKRKNSIIVCEARCTEGFNLIESFNYCKDNLIQYGGHVKAAGFTATPDKVSQFISCFKKFVGKNKDRIIRNKKIVIDAVLTVDNIENLEEFIETDFHFLQPFGEGNPLPVYLLKNVCPENDFKKINLRDWGIVPNPEKKYDLVFRHNGLLKHILDYRESSNDN